MANTITATVGANAAPFRKELGSLPDIAKATAKKMADESKRLVKEAEKEFQDALKGRVEAEKATAERVRKIKEDAAAQDAKRHADAANAGKQGLATIGRGIAGASNAGDLMATGFEAIGNLAGPVAGVVAGAGLIAKGMWDAAEAARQARKEMGEMTREASRLRDSGAGSGDLLGSGLAIGQTLNQKRKDKAEAVTKLGPLGGAVEGTVSNTLFGGLTEKAWDTMKAHPGATIGGAIFPGMGTAIGAGVDHFAGLGNGPTTKDKDLAAEEKLAKTGWKNVEQSVKARQEENALIETRLKMSERAGDLAELELRTRREIQKVQMQLGEKGATEKQINTVTTGMLSSAAMEADEINRKAGEAWRDYAEEIESAGDRSKAALAAVTSQMEALRMEKIRLEKEAGRENVRAHEGTEEQNLAHLQKEAAKKNELLDLDLRRKETEKAIAIAQQDSGFAQEQAQIGVTAQVNRQLGSKQLLVLLSKELATLEERRKTTNEAGAAALNAQAAGIAAQVKQLQNARNLMTPDQKRAEKKQDAHNERVINAHAAGEAAQAGNHRDPDRAAGDTAKNAARNAAERERSMGKGDVKGLRSGGKPWSGERTLDFRSRRPLAEELTRGIGRGMEAPAITSDLIKTGVDATMFAQNVMKLLTQPSTVA